MNRLLFIWIVTALPAFGQEKLGISNSNYSPSNSIFLNPSSSVDSKTFIQLNFIGVNAYAKNNIAYLPDLGLIKAYRDKKIPRPVRNEEGSRQFFYGSAGVEGPVFVISKGNFGAGAFVRARMVINVRRLPYQLSSLLFLQPPQGPAEAELDVRNAGFANMTWLEYGGNFGMVLLKSRSSMMTAGISAKYISGINIVYAQMDELKGLFNESGIRIDTLRGRLRFNQIAMNSGKGFGGDLGFTYKKMLGNMDSYFAHSKRSNCRISDYKYKIGLSLRDIGYIRFTANTQVADYSASGFFKTDFSDASTRQAANLSVNTPLRQEPVTGSLPASLSAQLDYNFENNIYLNVTAVKNLVPSRITGVQGPDLLSVCPRFETKNFEAALPLTLYKYIYPQVGLAFRVRSFALGFDNLIPLFIARDTYGVGVYFNLAVSIFRNPACNTARISVADCPPGDRKAKRSKKNIFRSIFGRNKTYSK